MAAKKENNKSEKEFFDITGMKAQNIRRMGKKGIIAFSLCGKGLGLYNLRIVESKEGHKFIAAPQEKGKDGNYYGVYAVYISEEDQKKIIAAVEKAAPAPEPEEDGSDIDF